MALKHSEILSHLHGVMLRLNLQKKKKKKLLFVPTFLAIGLLFFFLSLFLPSAIVLAGGVAEPTPPTTNQPIIKKIVSYTHCQRTTTTLLVGSVDRIITNILCQKEKKDCASSSPLFRRL